MSYERSFERRVNLHFYIAMASLLSLYTDCHIRMWSAFPQSLPSLNLSFFPIIIAFFFSLSNTTISQMLSIYSFSVYFLAPSGTQSRGLSRAKLLNPLSPLEFTHISKDSWKTSSALRSFLKSSSKFPVSYWTLPHKYKCSNITSKLLCL